MVGSVESHSAALAAEICHVLEQIDDALGAATSTIGSDPDAAVDDLLAARLLTATLLLKLRTPAID